jgi:transcriptional regulator with XRE-family HTH domain
LKKSSLQVLGDRIREARKKKGLSQEELAYVADIDRSYMGGVERGESNLSIAKLCQVALVLEVDLGELCKGLPVEKATAHLRRTLR